MNRHREEGGPTRSPGGDVWRAGGRDRIDVSAFWTTLRTRAKVIAADGAVARREAAAVSAMPAQKDAGRADCEQRYEGPPWGGEGEGSGLSGVDGAVGCDSESFCGVGTSGKESLPIMSGNRNVGLTGTILPVLEFWQRCRFGAQGRQSRRCVGGDQRTLVHNEHRRTLVAEQTHGAEAHPLAILDRPSVRDVIRCPGAAPPQCGGRQAKKQ